MGEPRHEALLYDDEAHLCDAALRFVREGLAQDELVYAVTSHNDMLRDALGADASPVSFLDGTEWFARPGHTLVTYRHLVEEIRGRSDVRARVLAEAVWTTRDHAEVSEWQRFEATVNAMFADAPVHILCCYDKRECSAEVQAGALATHPALHQDGRRQANPAYVDPESFIDQLEHDLDLPSPPAAAMALPLDGDLADLRRVVHQTASEAAVPPDRADDAALIVNELVSNVR